MNRLPVVLAAPFVFLGCASRDAEPAASPGAVHGTNAYGAALSASIHPALATSRPGMPPPHAAGRRNAYEQVNLVANRPEFNPTVMVDPLLADGWGMAIRPPGAGGHFWISNAASGTTTLYIGDVDGVPLYQDHEKVVTIPKSRLYATQAEKVSQPTGQVFTGFTTTDFQIPTAGKTASAKFLFVTLDGTVAAWNEGEAATTVYDNSLAGSMYTGCAVTTAPEGNRLYLCDFGLETFAVLDAQFRPVKIAGDFRDPQVPDTYCVYNMQYLDGLLYVTFARMGDDPGEEDIYPGYGYLAAFDTEGRLVKSFEHRIELNGPWGIARAPADFGAMSGTLLVSNFGDGTVIAFDPDSGRFIDYLRDTAGEPIKIDGIWGVLFGNGVRLGRTNHLYFAAGPNNEEDGLFGKLVPLTP